MQQNCFSPEQEEGRIRVSHPVDLYLYTHASWRTVRDIGTMSLAIVARSLILGVNFFLLSLKVNSFLSH
jgi:hypothetical protein